MFFKAMINFGLFPYSHSTVGICSVGVVGGLWGTSLQSRWELGDRSLYFLR
jgi:hypothetical protein